MGKKSSFPLGDKRKERTQIRRGHFVSLTVVASSAWTSPSPHLLSTEEKLSFVVESLSSESYKHELECQLLHVVYAT